MSLSNKLSRLEESLRILESKNLYLQDENQRLKGVNEGMSTNRVGQNVINSESQCNPRFLILENEKMRIKQCFHKDGNYRNNEQLLKGSNL